jgi:ATP-dependent DNA helicase DinG
MKIYIPSDLPEPPSHNWQPSLKSFLVDVHQATQGGVLSLFTSRRDLLNFRDHLQDVLQPQGLEILAQDGMLSMQALQERFIADSNASLLATKSFWEGFDAGGDTLRCVVIPKLPFGRPDTPLSMQRNAVYGRSAWARYDLPDAILELKQAVGRLVRSSTDTGTVILGDSRILSKNYGRRVVDALPVKPEVLPMSEIITRL